MFIITPDIKALALHSKGRKWDKTIFGGGGGRCNILHRLHSNTSFFVFILFFVVVQGGGEGKKKSGEMYLLPPPQCKCNVMIYMYITIHLTYSKDWTLLETAIHTFEIVSQSMARVSLNLNMNVEIWICISVEVQRHCSYSYFCSCPPIYSWLYMVPAQFL